MTVSQLIRRLLIDSFWMLFFFTLYKAKMTYDDHEKTKNTLTTLRTVCEGGLPNYCCVYSRWCFLFLFFWGGKGYDNFVFIYLFIFFSLDINECVRELYKCSSDAFCNNTKGSYNFTCTPGFTGNERECKGKRWGRNIEEISWLKVLVRILTHRR